MRTPKEYTDRLKRNEITKDMLSHCLYSVNKRAKNYRDKESEYRGRGQYNRYYYDKYGNEEKYREKKEEYYKKKEKLLSVLNPVCIHEEHQRGTHLVQYNDYEPEYDEIMRSGDYEREGEYYDRELREYVSYVKVREEHENIRYYLFYDMGEYSFHTPIEDNEVKEMKAKFNVGVTPIDTIVTFGKEINDLISAQFVDKVLALIESEKYVLLF